MTSALVEIAAPLPAVRWTLNAAQAEAVIFRIASRITADDHVVARLQGLACHALLGQLQHGAPLDSIAHAVALSILRFHMHQRMRVPEEKLDELTFDTIL